MKKMFFAGAASAALLVGGWQLAPEAITQVPFAGTSSALTVDDERGVLTMAPLLERTTPAVVNIATEGTRSAPAREMQDMEDMFRRFFGDQFEDSPFGDRQSPRSQPRERPTASVGSGVIVDASRGLILTNAHVIDGADTVQITLKDRRVLDAEIVGADDQTDIAVIQVDAQGLTALDFADSERLKVGDYVVAIGNPFGIGQSVTSGIISALGRQSGFRGDSYQDYIQTDAAINQGNSGGALINSRGELVGINTAILSRSGGSNGIGFAVPARMAESVMRQLVEYGEVRRGRIGVGIQDITPALMEAYDLSVSRGAIVTQVTDGTPAARAGLEPGDVIVGFNGEDITGAADIRNTVGLVEAGTRTDITYLRDGRRRTARIEVEALPDEDAREAGERVTERSAEPASLDSETFEGATVTDIPGDVDLRGGEAGVYVTEVERGSSAWRGGLRRGDVIRRVDRRAVDDLDAFGEAMERRDGTTAVEIDRQGTPLFLAIR